MTCRGWLALNHDSRVRPLPPRLKEFLTFILSREGQQAVADDGMYIPLNAEAAQAELSKLD